MGGSVSQIGKMYNQISNDDKNQIAGGLAGAKGAKDYTKSINQGLDWDQNAFNNATRNLNPYVQAGQSAIPQYQQFASQMADPSQYVNSILSKWKMSPQAQMQLQEGTKAANQGAAASGMLGSGAFQKELMKYGQDITNADQNQYLNQVTGVGNEYEQMMHNLMSGGLSAGQSIMSGTNQMADEISKMFQQQGMGNLTKDIGKGNAASGISNLL
jgi:ATP-dependent Clp protease ATP-binding subunit ClpA